MKELAATVGILIIILGISVAAPVFGFIMGVTAAVFFIYILMKDHSDSIAAQKKAEQDRENRST